jgi:hypothetical protein
MRNNIIDLVGAWKNGGVQQRQELAVNLFPEGCALAKKTPFLNRATPWLMNIMHEMNADILAGKTTGVGDGN